MHCASERTSCWFDLADGNEMQADEAGVFRIETFSGLWINGPAVIARDYRTLMQMLDAGLATPEHAAFVQGLAARQAKK